MLKTLIDIKTEWLEYTKKHDVGNLHQQYDELIIEEILNAQNRTSDSGLRREH